MDPSNNVVTRLLPGGSRIVESRRDYIVVSLPLGAAHQNVAVIWDRGRDEQALDVLTALTYRDPQLRSRIVGLQMDRGVLTCWYASDKNLQQDRNAIQLAADAALNAPVKRWTVAPLVPVPMDRRHDRVILDRGNLVADHPLLQIPEKYQLGLIGTNKGGNSRVERT